MNPAAELLLSFCCVALLYVQFAVQQKKGAVEQVTICRSKC